MSQPPVDPARRPRPTPSTAQSRPPGEPGTDPALREITQVPTRRSAKRRKKSRRRRRIAFVAGAMSLFLICGLLGVVYAATRIPLPSQVTNNQSSIIYYSDGHTEIARVGAENRTDVSLDKTPKQLQHAVLAAENRDFYTNSGVSPKGIARALWANVRGKDLQGGSTITQQYVKNAYNDRERTYTRKFREMVIAVKMDKNYSKDQILEWYLNTIYFGRGAYGIEAAAETYFGQPATNLNLAQSAVLASSIRSPALYDPQEHAGPAKARWDYVLDGMVKQRWLSPEARTSLIYPKVRPIGVSRFNDLSGPKGYIVRQVSKELAAKGFPDEVIRRGGFRIVTTINKQAQDSAVAAVNKVFVGEPKDMRQSLVAVEPGSGRVRAYYGGKIGNGAFDYASHSYQPGSSIKPYVLAEALSQGISLKSFWNGTSPQDFPDRPGQPVYNSGDGQGHQCQSCDLIRSTVLSLNTVFYALTAKVGAKNAAERARLSGIKTLAGKPIEEFISSGKLTNNFGIGQFEISPLDQAAGYATFAAKGVHHDPYFVEKVTRSDGSDAGLHSSRGPGERAFSADVAADADYALQQVVKAHRDRRLEDSRPAAAKTGTVQDPRASRLTNRNGNSAAWMCGFTPQLAAAVWVGHDDLKKPLVDKSGAAVFGIGLPGELWKEFMDGAMRGAAIVDFAKPVYLGKPEGNQSPPAPSPSPTPAASPSPQPSPQPSKSPKPKPSKSCKNPPLCPPAPP